MSSHLSYFSRSSDGYYRYAWLIADSALVQTEANRDNFVLKQMQIPSDDDDTDHTPNPRSFSKIQREAIIMERLTASPRIISTFGHCALSILAETTPHEVADFIVPNSGHANQTEQDELPQIRSLNNYTMTEKIDMALESK